MMLDWAATSSYSRGMPAVLQRSVQPQGAWADLRLISHEESRLQASHQWHIKIVNYSHILLWLGSLGWTHISLSLVAVEVVFCFCLLPLHKTSARKSQPSLQSKVCKVWLDIGSGDSLTYNMQIQVALYFNDLAHFHFLFFLSPRLIINK